MFVVLGKKNRIEITSDEVPELPESMELSGADIEGIVTRAHRLALIEGADDVCKTHLQKALDDFMPSAEGDEKKLQVFAAVIECTDKNFLPEKFREGIGSPEARAALLQRFRELRLSVETQ